VAGFIQKIMTWSGKKRRLFVCIVDDEPEFLTLFTRLLVNILDADILSFTSPDGLLEFTRVHNKIPDLVLSDVNMPKLNGFQLKRKAWNQWQVKVPFVFITGLDGEDETDNSEMVIISKPVNMDLLKDELHQIFSEDHPAFK